MKRLFRSQTNRTIAGIFGGLGEYFDVDPVIFRLVYVFLTIFTGVVPGIVVYIFATFIIPREPFKADSQ